MCELCHASPCLTGCPNAPEPKAVYHCANCSSSIIEGEGCYEIDGEIYCECCIEDMTPKGLVEMVGGRYLYARGDD